MFDMLTYDDNTLKGMTPSEKLYKVAEDLQSVQKSVNQALRDADVDFTTLDMALRGVSAKDLKPTEIQQLARLRCTIETFCTLKNFLGNLGY